MEVRADVAVGVATGGAVGRLGLDDQLVRQAALPGGIARGEEPAPVRAGDDVGVAVHRAVRDLVAPARSRGRRPVREGRHGITRRSSGPQSGCMPPGSERWVAVMSPDSSRRSRCIPFSSPASSARVPSGVTSSRSAGSSRRSRMAISSTSRSGRDEPDDPGSALRSARSRSSWYTSDRGFSASNNTNSATAATLTVPGLRRR